MVSKNERNNLLDQFISLTGSDYLVAELYLKQNQWVLNTALNNFYDNVTETTITPIDDDNEYMRPLSDLYEKYAVDTGDVLEGTGLMNLVDDLSYKIEDIVTLCLAKMIGCESFSKPVSSTRFIQNLQAYKCKTLNDIKLQLQEDEKKLEKNLDFFITIYNYCFSLILELNEKSVDINTAIEYWPLFFGTQNYIVKPTNENLNEWIKFLKLINKQSISKDEWSMLPRFFQHFPSIESLKENYSERYSWPYLFDEYHDYLDDNGMLD